MPALRLPDQHVCDDRGIPDAFRLQEILQPRLLLVERFDHVPGGAQFLLRPLAIDLLQFFIFDHPIGFELVRGHRLGLLRHTLDRAYQAVTQVAGKLGATQPRARRVIELFHFRRHRGAYPGRP